MRNLNRYYFANAGSLSKHPQTSSGGLTSALGSATAASPYDLGLQTPLKKTNLTQLGIPGIVSKVSSSQPLIIDYNLQEGDGI